MPRLQRTVRWAKRGGRRQVQTIERRLDRKLGRVESTRDVRQLDKELARAEQAFARVIRGR